MAFATIVKDDESCFHHTGRISAGEFRKKRLLIRLLRLGMYAPAGLLLLLGLEIDHGGGQLHARIVDGQREGSLACQLSRPALLVLLRRLRQRPLDGLQS